MDDNASVFVISVAAELAGMHPQTLRQYDRLGIVIPARTSGRGRRYSRNDIHTLRQVQKLSQEEGINLEGIRRILQMQREIDQLQDENRRLRNAVVEAQTDAVRARRVFAAGTEGNVEAMRAGNRPRRPSRSGALVLYRPPALQVVNG